MDFVAKINCDGAAFDGDALVHELARIVRGIANHLADGHVTGSTVDVNGNVCGEYVLRGTRA